jgi:hypothetical protein
MKKIKTIALISLFTLLVSLFTFAYYTNTNKFFEDSRKDDGNSGFALQRTANEFIVNGSGPGTMLDTVTGLTWQQDMTNAGTKTWASVNTYAEPTWNNATKVYSYPSGKSNYPAFSYCEDLVQGNYNDYRLPSRDELMTLINEIGTSGSTCTTLGSFGFTNCQNSYYWTEDEYKASTSVAWDVTFDGGNDNYYDKTNTYYVVCVRRD